MTFIEALLSAATATIGVRETGGNNRGPEIDEWLRGVGCPTGQPWCAAWVYAMHRRAAVAVGAAHHCPRTAGALKMWHMAPAACRRELAAPGDVFVLDTGGPGGYGHVGIVVAVSPDGRTITTVEGNTNGAGSREGNQVATHTWRPADGKRGTLVGYLSLGPADEDEDEDTDPVGLPPSPFG